MSLAQVSWHEGSYSASKFFLSARTTLALRFESAQAEARRLREPPGAPGAPAQGASVAVVQVESDLPFGREEKVTVWLDAATGRALQWEKLSTGGKPYYKLMRYTEDGFFQWRRAPRGSAEKQKGFHDWSDRSERTVSLPAAAGAPVLTDSYVLLLLASAARLEAAGSSAVFQIISSDRRIELTFTAAGLTLRRCSFDERWPGGGRQRSAQLVTREVVVKAKVLGGSDDPDTELGFMGLKGELSIFVEQGTGIPVELSGRAATIGRLVIRLDRVALREAPDL